MSERASLFSFHVSGTEESSGTVLRAFEQTGQIEAEGMGSALERLVQRDLWWDTLDTSRPVTITIVPRDTDE